MSLAIKYETVEDAKMRLRNTVVLYKGVPVLINDVQKGEGKDDILRVLMNELPVDGAGNKKMPRGKNGLPPNHPLYQPLDDDDVKRKYISSKHFDIAPFRMGYVNRATGAGAYYCTRLPNRMQKQGLCSENFSAKTNSGIGVSWQEFITCKEVPAMVANEYPTFKRAIEMLAKVSSVAFHRDFALVADTVIPELVYVFHKGDKVGMFSRGEVTLGKNFKCLKEALEEKGVRVGVF